MINSRLLSNITLLFVLTACSNLKEATTSFRSTFDFSAVKTYSTYDRNSTFGEIQNLHGNTRNTIELSIEQSLDSKGLSYKTPQNADIMISYYVIGQNFTEFKHYNREVKYCSYCLKVGQVSRQNLQSITEEGSLILDIIDPKKQRSVWRSVYPLGFKEEDNSREIQEKIITAVDSMLNDYPKGKQ